MTNDLYLRRKWTLQAHGQQVVFIKNKNERTAHVLMKAFLWALYLPQYPNATVEIRIGDRYKPDVVSLNEEGKPLFWAEAGQVSAKKIRAIARRYPDTHFAIAKWHTKMAPLQETVQKAIRGLRRTAPFDLLIIPNDSEGRFIDDYGQIHLQHDQLEWIQITNPS
ncbi:MAG: hypothetical protein AAF629_28980 [Chloroflexota bacterium]